MTTLLDLPVELRELVYAALPAADRARLNMALPKDMRLAPAIAKGKERTLGVLAGAVRKQRVKKVTPAIRDFLCTVPKTDPTWADIVQGLPDARDVPYVPKFQTLEDKLWAKATTAEDLPEILALTPPRYATRTLARVSADLFDVALSDEKHRDAARAALQDTLEQDSWMFTFTLLNYQNFALLHHLLNAPATGAVLAQLQALMVEHLCKADMLIAVQHNAGAQQVVFECVPVPRATVEALHVHALEALNIDAALFYERHLMTS